MEKFLALSIKKQDTIRNAALACFAKHGYEKASINDIAVAAGISKASIFQYFGNKQALYQYLFDYCAAQMKQAYNTSALEETTDFFDRVWEASVMKVENLKKHPHIASFISITAEYLEVPMLYCLTPLKFFDVYTVAMSGIQFSFLLLAMIIAIGSVITAQRVWMLREI